MSSPPTAVAPSGAALQTPTRYRYGVLAFACILSMVTYLDRVCIGTVAPYIETEFQLTKDQLGYLFGAFTLAYASFEVPSGWLGDVFGPGKTLIRIVLWWSLFTFLTGVIYPSEWVIAGTSLSVSFVLLLVVRFMFGLGEAGAYPNIARAFHNWFPFQERGFAKGTVWMAGRFAGGVTTLVVLAMLVPSGHGVPHWRHTFWVFGFLGVVWCGLFWWWFRDQPEQKAGVNAAEIALIRGSEPVHETHKLRVPWRQVFLSPNLWFLYAMYACASYGWYFNITYLRGFLSERFGIQPGEQWSAPWWSFSLLAGLPLLLGSLACLLGGLATDMFIRRTGNRKWGRRLFGVLGHGLCAAFYLLAIGIMGMAPTEGDRTRDAWLFVLAIAVATFWNDMTMGSAWASCLDVGGKFSGVVAGCMNTFGNLGGFLANIMTGWILNYYIGDLKKGSAAYQEANLQGWTINFIIFAAVYVVAVVMWLNFNATRALVPEPQRS